MCTIPSSLLIYLHLIFDILQFEISSLMNWIFFIVWNGLLQTTQAVKIQFKLGKKSTLSTQNFKLENVKNQVQIDRMSNSFNSKVHDLWFNKMAMGVGYLSKGGSIYFFSNPTLKMLFWKIIKGGKRALVRTYYFHKPGCLYSEH